MAGIVVSFLALPSLAQEFIPEPGIVYYGSAPQGQVVQIDRGTGQPVGTAVLVTTTAGEQGYVAQVDLVAPLSTPVPTPPDGKAYVGTRATVFVNSVAQGQVVLDERGAIYRLAFPSPALTPSPNAVLTPERIVPEVPTPPSCGAVACTPTATRTQTATPTQTRTLTNTPTPTPTSTAAVVHGSVDLQGRPAKPAPVWSVPLRVAVYRNGETTALSNFTPTTDQNGSFRVEGMPPGAYSFLVKNAKTLQVRKDQTLTSGVNAVSFGTLLAGDANDDNQVSLLDFSILRSTFGLAVGQGAFDARADFNDNQSVTLLDFSLLRPNFSLAGATIEAGAGGGGGGGSAVSESFAQEAATPTPTAIVRVDVVAPKGVIGRGQTFEVRLEVGSSFQEIDGAAAYLDYDPELLQVVGLTPGPTLPQVLQNQIATPGQVNFAAGTFDKFPKGRFVLATVQFRALSDVVDTTLHLSAEGARQSDVTFAGRSVLVCLTDAALGRDGGALAPVTVVEPSIAPTPAAAATAEPTASATPTATEVPESRDAPLLEPEAESSGGCQTGGSPSGLGWLVGMLGLLARLRRRNEEVG